MPPPRATPADPSRPFANSLRDPNEPAIHVRSLRLAVAATPILRGLSLTLPHAQLGVLLGPNGCGKSTLLRILAGYNHPTAGSVSVLGHTLGQCNVHDLRRHLRIVAGAALPPVDQDLSTRDAVLTGHAGTIGLFHRPTRAQRAEADAALRKMSLAHAADRPVDTLSSGERVRMQIARALQGDVRLLLLDEPAAGLDMVARHDLLRSLAAPTPAAPGPAILLVTHHVEEIPPRTHIAWLMRAGRILAAGHPRQVINSANLSRAFGGVIRVGRRGGHFNATVRPTR